MPKTSPIRLELINVSLPELVKGTYQSTPKTRLCTAMLELHCQRLDLHIFQSIGKNLSRGKEKLDYQDRCEKELEIDTNLCCCTFIIIRRIVCRCCAKRQLKSTAR